MDNNNSTFAAELYTESLYPCASLAHLFEAGFRRFLTALPVDERWFVLEGLELFIQYQSEQYITALTFYLMPILAQERMCDGVAASAVQAISPTQFLRDYVIMADASVDPRLRSHEVADVIELQVVPLRRPKPVVKVSVWNTLRKKPFKRPRRLEFGASTILLEDYVSRPCPVVNREVDVSRLTRNIFSRVVKAVRKELREPRRVWTVAQARAHRFANVVLQGGREVKPRTRAERDEKQRECATQKLEAVRKAQPKAERERKVLESRDKRHPCLKYSEVELQSGALKHVLTAGATLLGVELWKTLRSGRKTSDAFSALLSQFSEYKSMLTRFLGKTLWMVPFVCTIYYAITHFKLVGDPLLTVLLSVASGLVGSTAWKHVAKFFQDCNVASDSGVQLQAGVVEVMPRLLSTMMCFSVFGRKFSPSTVTEFAKRLSMLDRLSHGWDTFLRWSLESVETLVNFVRARFGKEKISVFNNVHKPTYEWASRVDKLLLEHSTAEKEVDAESLNVMVKLIREGHGFKELYRGTSMARYVDEYTMKASNLLQPYLGTINARNNFRFEPLCCMLLGAPGVGKTVLAVPLCAAVLLESGLLPRDSDPDVVFENIWQKGTSEYWNSYASQLCLVMDDAFQQRADPTDKDSEYMNLIRMVGSWSFPLNFADLTSKGKIFFGSKFIFGTTNLRSFNAEAGLVIQEPEAVSRRISYPYKLCLKPEYACENGRLNQEVYRRECERCAENEVGVDRFPWYMWEVHRHDFITGHTANESMPLRDLVMEIADALRERSRGFTATKSYLVDFIQGMNKVELQSGRVVGVDLSTFARALGDFTREQRQMSAMAVRFLKVIGVGIVAKLGFDVIRAVLGSIWGFLSGIFKRSPVPQSNRPLARKTQPLKPNGIRLQSIDSNVCTNVYSNTYKMLIMLPCGSPYVIGQVCMVSDTLAVQPEHFTATIRDMLRTEQVTRETGILFRHSMNNEHSFSLSVGKYLSFERVSDADMDVEFLKFEDVRAHRNIVGSFIREADIKYLSGVRGRIDICEVDDRKSVLEKVERNVFTFPSMKYGTSLRIVNRRLNRYFTYTAPTTPGDCGAPLCIFDNSSYSGRTAIGMHVSGNATRGQGYSNIITQEMIMSARDKLRTIDDQFAEDLAARGVTLQSGNVLPFQKAGSFLSIGVVERPVIICPKTSFYPTKHYGVIGEHGLLPAPLSPVWRDGVLVYPMENAVAAYSTPVYIYEQTWLRQALHVAMSPTVAMTRDYSRRLYTFEEAVCGVPQEKFRSIPRGTAAGFPYVYDVRNGKKEFFGEGQDYDLTNKNALILRERVNYIINSAKNGTRLAHVFVDFLKDELRTAAKVKDVATRLISSAPLDYTIAWRMYFGAFSSAVMRVHTLSGMAPGICTYTDWDKLALMLRKKGSKVFDGDFKGFDSSEQPTIHRLILEFINQWYADGVENARVREVLWLDLLHSRHIGGLGNDQRHIYQWNKSLPSGHPFTTIVNSIYSLFTMVGAYISTTGDLTGFWNHVSSVVYGDDNVSNIDDDVCELFNQATVAKALADEFKLTYTSGKKDGILEPYTTLDEVSFLKRHIVERNGWLCPLELESFLFTFYWCKNRKLEDKILHDVLETALEELSMHTAETWERYAPKLYRILEEAGHVGAAPCDQESYLNVIRSRSDNWY